MKQTYFFLISDFNPQGPRGPRPAGRKRIRNHQNYFNPQGPRGPRPVAVSCHAGSCNFNPQGPRGPRLCFDGDALGLIGFQSTRPSRASTIAPYCGCFYYVYFNPQGPRGPRHSIYGSIEDINLFQSTRPSRASTPAFSGLWPAPVDFNPQGPRGPRQPSVICSRR